MIKKLEKDQEKFYKKIKKDILLNSTKSGLNIFTYLSVSEKLSFNKMKNILDKKNLIKYTFEYIKSVLSFFYYYQYSIHKNVIEDNNSKLIITWGKLTDFNINGQFNDRFLGLRSNEQKKTLWVIQLDGNLTPKIIDKNIIILKKSNKKKFYFFYIIKFFKEIKLNLRILNNLSSKSLYALIFFHKINSEVDYSKIKNIILPYEGQPFQKHFIRKVKKKNTNIIGYIHAYPQPIPFNLFNYPQCSPNKIVVNSKSLKKTLIDYFKWKKKHIIIKDSSRFYKDTKIDMTKKIFLPYAINESKRLLILFSNYLKVVNNNSLPLFEIQIHPEKINDKYHKKFKEKLIEIISNNKDKFIKNKKNKISLFFGYTSSIIEALERGAKVVQICSVPILETYTSLFAYEIKCKKINKFTYEYDLIKKNSLIKMNKVKYCNTSY